MNKFIVLGMIALLGTVAAHEKFVDTKSALLEVDSDPFGNIVLSAIQTTLQTGGSADEINILLNGILQALSNDQKEQDSLYRTEHTICVNWANQFDQIISYHLQQLNANTQLRDDTLQLLADAEAQLRQVIADIEANDKLTAREQATRDDQHSTWAGKDADLEHSLSLVDEAIKFVQHLQLGASFAQLSTKYDVLQKKLKENTSHSTLFKPIISALAELSTTVDHKAIQRIAQLLNELRQQLVEERQELQSVEDRQAAHWAEFSAHLSDERARLVTRKQDLESNINQYHEDVTDAEEFIEFHTIEHTEMSSNLQSLSDWCVVIESTYHDQSDYRARQSDLLYGLQDRVLSHLASSQQFLANRTGK